MPIDDFDPNDRDKGAPSWASYAPDRYQAKFKLHRHRGHAISAFLHNRRCVIYKRESGVWVEQVCRDHAMTLPTICDYCGAPTTTSSTGWSYNAGRQVFEKATNGKLREPLTPLWLCNSCRYNLGF